MSQKIASVWTKVRTAAGSIVAVAAVVAAAAPLVAHELAGFLVDVSDGTALELGALAEDIVQYGATVAAIAAAVAGVVSRVTRVPEHLQGLEPIDVAVIAVDEVGPFQWQPGKSQVIPTGELTPIVFGYNAPDEVGPDGP